MPKIRRLWLSALAGLPPAYMTLPDATAAAMLAAGTVKPEDLLDNPPAAAGDAVVRVWDRTIANLPPAYLTIPAATLVQLIQSGAYYARDVVSGGDGGGVTPPAPVTLAVAPSYSQPSATQRFYLAKASGPVTFSAIGADAADITLTTIDSQTALFSQSQAAAAAQIPTATGAKSFSIVGTPIGDGQAVVAATAINLQAGTTPAAVSANFQSDLTGAAGTALTSKAGWALSGADHGHGPTLNGSGHAVTDGNGSNNNDYGYLASPGGQFGGQIGSMNASFAAAARYTIINTLIGASDYSAGILLRTYVDTGSVVFQFHKRTFANGTATDTYVSNRNPVALKSDGTFSLQWAVSADGKTLHVSIVGGATDTFDLDITGAAAGTKAGFVGSGGASYFGAGVEIISLNVASPATTLTITDAPIWSTDNTLTVKAAWGITKPTAYQHDFGDGNWLTGVSTINNDGTSTYVASAPDGASRTLRLRPLNDTPVVVSAPYPTRFIAGALGVPKARFGINEGFLTNQQSAGVPDVMANWLATACWRTSGNGYVRNPDDPASGSDATAGSVGMGVDGIPHAAGDYIYQVGPIAAPEHQGTATITFAPGTTINSVSGASNSAISGTSVSFTAPTSSTPLIYIHYDGSNGAGLTTALTNPTPGANTGKVTTAASRASIAASKVKSWRPMSSTAANNDRVAGTTTTNLPLRTWASRWQGSLSMGPLSIEKAVAIANEWGVDLDWTETTCSDADTITKTAQYVAANLNPSLGASIENGNEVWNPAFLQYTVEMLRGLRAGYAPSGVTTAGQAAAETIIDATGVVNPSTRVTSQAFNSGDKIFVAIYGSGWLVYVANKAVASNTTLPDPKTTVTGSGDANFNIRYDFGQCDRARVRQHAQRTVLHAQAWRTAFAAAGRPAPLVRLGAQWGGGYAAIKPAVDWMRAAGVIPDEICIAPYFSFIGGVETADLNSPDIPGWTSVEKNLYSTNPAAWVSAYVPILAKSIDYTTMTAVQFAADLSADNIAANGGNTAHARDIVLGFYEFGLTGAGFQNYPNPGDPTSAISVAVQTLVRDQRFGALWSRMLGNCAALIGGKMDLFDRVGVVTATGPWAMAETENDFDISGDGSTNWRWKALAAASAANA